VMYQYHQKQFLMQLILLLAKSYVKSLTFKNFVKINLKFKTTPYLNEIVLHSPYK
jgi:hypothetical protein